MDNNEYRIVPFSFKGSDLGQLFLIMIRLIVHGLLIKRYVII